MSEVVVWVSGMWHQCCGPARQVGQQVDLDLTFTGEVADAGNTHDSIAVLGDGRVDITGTALGLAEDGEDDERRGTLVRSGGLRFGAEAALDAGSRVRCIGYLSDLPHGEPYGHTTGTLTKIRWHDWRRSDAAGGQLAPEDYGPWLDLTSTNQRPSSSLDHPDWEFELTVVVE
jgi:hypothetical protein